ncbi:hypothetical protein P152DRAFT_458696 [Eremomyces bilateralis CBS 781.70]|uniref:Mediator of RNA polymerase II transcription subunit 1 n=1 Tax=Eremomyces bilateralis CBS 781.70 TaxID=1392243 RepID=A0A6G1G3D1_9PEZI|nr:uncharacterized protein P152DRAFT_458696 [Eremomyces bilateralis CBS 781.70]KAF1812319.1 hypothetical protein P152DRAFT_458696 [Eremomyces bilateralis CBS 781.70]
MDLSTATDKPPAVRFVAKLHPPVVVPWHVAHHLYTAVEAPFPPENSGRCALFEDLVVQADAGDASGEGDGMEAVTTVLTQGASRETEVRHRNVLSSDRSEFGFVVESLPFSHPKQLVMLLPVRAPLSS